MAVGSFPPIKNSAWLPPMGAGNAPNTMTNQQEQITRIRLRYTKGPSLRFTGHLDMQRLWERLLRRSGLPIRYSQGYNPRARLNLASALPLGVISEAEMLDFWMNQPIPLEDVARQLNESSLPGLEIREVTVRLAAGKSRPGADDRQ